MSGDVEVFVRTFGGGVARAVHDRVSEAVKAGRTDESDAVKDWITGIAAVCAEAVMVAIRDCEREAANRGAGFDRRAMAQYAAAQFERLLRQMMETSDADQAAHDTGTADE